LRSRLPFAWLGVGVLISLAGGPVPQPAGEALPQAPSRGSAGLEAAEAEAPSPRTLHELGLLRLSQGRLDAAILNLEAAAAGLPGEGGPLNDLATALLARAGKERRAFDLILALEAASKALERQPDLLEAKVNRARALTRLHLRLQARLAWGACLEQDSSTASEAERQLALLSGPTIQQTWERELPGLNSAAANPDSFDFLSLATRFPQPARLWAEERLLTSWAAARQAGDLPAAARRLRLALGLGAALEWVTRDSMILDAAAVLEQAQGISGGARLSLLEQGHLDFGRAMELYNVQKFAEAEPLFVRAEQALRQAGSPFWGWAVFYRAIGLHYTQPEKALRAFSQLRADVDETRYPVLAGRSEWLLGTIANNSGRPEEALERYRKAFTLIDASTGPQLSAFVRLLMGEAYTAMGEVEPAWKERVAALATIIPTGEPRRVHAVLNEATGALLQLGRARAALFFAGELVNNARAWGNETALAEASLERGRTLDLLGKRQEAMVQLEAAAKHAAAMELRDRILAPLALARASAAMRSEPTRAVAVLSDALSTQLDDGYLYQVTRLLTARARAYRALGDDDRAEADLGAAIGEYERVRGGVREEQLRLSTFERAQEVFDEMIRLQTDRGRTEPAFEAAERSRSRVLLDLVLGHTGDLPEPGTAAGILSGLPPEVRLVEYAVLPDHLVVWVARRGALTSVVVPVSAADLARSVDAVRNALERRGGAAEIQAAAAHLHDLLIKPLAREIPGGTPLVIVPDRFLARVPFAALYDARRGRYLIEDLTVVVAPSATLYLSAVERRERGAAPGPPTVLAVGNPAFDRRLHPTLPRLMAAGEEAAEVAALYPGSELLEGEAATPSAFLAGARRHRWLHFAGHALLHPVSPRLSRLVLAPEPESPSGSLYAHEIARQSLAGTELVVLAACSTIDGGTGRRESLTGLAAAFLAAGPPVVVSSLWQADDRPAAQLMRVFYAALRNGADPAAALREAQISLLSGPDHELRSAAYWAGFEVLGGVVPQAPS
jgi:CHAT domain-containing protein